MRAYNKDYAFVSVYGVKAEIEKEIIDEVAVVRRKVREWVTLPVTEER